MSETLADVSGSVTPTWPADIIHVNEDGWVLVNRGRKHGIVLGLRLLVVGQGIRELRDLYPQADDSASDQPALRIRRTYEQLEVIHVDDRSSIAIATRTPPERRPSVYQGPDGELLVWVPLPEGFTWPRPNAADDHDEDVSDAPTDDATDITTDDIDGDRDAEATGETMDAPPELGEQDDERWEEALPLNGVNVGDIVLPAIPAAGVPASAPATIASIGEPHPNPFESGRNYDWIKPTQ
ncbi:MAG: hypothetical protein ACXWQR_20025 [Ktedonobacterales bacterium]